ncbi:hypothetical protein BDW59DRAFT_166756 [Aspergillus cavernicola]|uniref:Uncharacterized protein n=1 Tax=Aspergillus cavernicola TaxID=176166 RepID=A0ABR4HKA7_9EURO
MAPIMAPPATFQSNPPLNHRLSSAIPVDSLAEAQRRLKTFLRSTQCDNDLLLRLPPSILDNPAITRILHSSERGNFKYSYDPQHNILKVFAMPRPLHDAIVALVGRFLMKGCFVTVEEFDCLSMWTREQQMADTFAQGGVSWTKYPDALLMFGERPDAFKIPRIVFEVGFTETYDDLLNDMRQWFENAVSPVAVVVLVKIEEDLRELRKHRRSDGVRSEPRRLLIDYGDELAHSKHGIELDCDFSGSPIPGLRNIPMSDITVGDWVGPLKIFLELWEMDGTEPVLREPRIDILPATANPRNPKIRATDIIPGSHRGLFENFDGSRTGELDMSYYRAVIHAEISNLAYNRAVGQLRPESKERAQDPDYLP